MSTLNLIVQIITRSIQVGTPILFGTVGEIVNQKVGHLNLGVEGMMAMGACAGFLMGYTSNSLLVAMLGAFVAGALGGLIYALLTVTFMANQNVTGLTLSIFGVGLSNFIGQYFLVRAPGGTLKLPAGIMGRLGNLSFGPLSDIPVVGPLLFRHNIFIYLGIVAALAASFYLNRTRTGRNVRAIGENPAAADAAGIPVVRMKYIHLLLGGGICGIGGGYAAMISNGGVWLSNSVDGRGWIAVALVIFATWNPAKAILGAYLFGACSILKYYVPKPIVLGGLRLTIPNAVYDMFPFLVTALVLIIASIRQNRDKAQPAACGLPYFREER